MFTLAGPHKAQTILSQAAAHQGQGQGVLTAKAQTTGRFLVIIIHDWTMVPPMNHLSQTDLATDLFQNHAYCPL